ncbi:MAG: hypothetical protein BWY57_02341 [Betaproteobacteria bacterium ADurb.Bin341]|nr:MAG: hypothetical protein BWY57_02341 [Betaproteobacteria bacterium ADurb.Bin341]
MLPERRSADALAGDPAAFALSGHLFPAAVAHHGRRQLPRTGRIWWAGAVGRARFDAGGLPFSGRRHHLSVDPGQILSSGGADHPVLFVAGFSRRLADCPQPEAPARLSGTPGHFALCQQFPHPHLRLDYDSGADEPALQPGGGDPRHGLCASAFHGPAALYQSRKA